MVKNKAIFDELCIFSGMTYCKKGYLKCVPHLCRYMKHGSKKRVEHPRTKEIVQLQDYRLKL